MFNEDNIQDLKAEIKRLKEERKKDYEKLLEQYNIALRHLKNESKKYGGEDYIKGFLSGLLSGMVLLDDNLVTNIND